MNNLKCCEKPFTQFNITTGLTNCLNCNKKYKIIEKIYCPKCNADQGQRMLLLNLEKDGCTDWAICSTCHVTNDDMFHQSEFRRETHIKFT